MRFTPAFLDEIRARLPVSQVVARKVPLKRKGREFAGLSPFKDEKTPSFFVNDQKGFYHCFASGEHGDIFKFLMVTEGLPFPEAVERLAGEAGIPMPVQQAPTREMIERADERTRLYELLETACRYFQDELKGARGREARDYINRRGLQRDTLAAFRIGYAPADRGALKSYLAEAGYTLDEMGTSGMLIHGDDIRVPYDRFRDRVIFPITDLKDRVIAFGGRALDPNVPAKYLNSPETPLFHKGSIVYNAVRARQPAYERNQIIVVEGYMDVIALNEGGFANAVAPLGTALTQDQMRLLWRYAPEPLLCFDGDSAGRKAAYRAIDTALPMLGPGASLGFAFLPDGSDPDDLLRREGAGALESVLARSHPLAEVLWQREWGDGNWHTPERRAALEKQIFQLLERIEDQPVRTQYQRVMRDKLFQSWRSTGGPRPNRNAGANRSLPKNAGNAGQWSGAHRSQGFGGNARGGGRSGGYGYSQPLQASSALKQSRMVAGAGAQPPSREALLIYVLLNHPWLIDDQAEEIAVLEFTSGALGQLRDEMLSAHALNNPLDRTAIRNQLTGAGFEKVISQVERAITHKSDKFADPDTDRTDVEAGWLHAVALHGKQLGLKRALDAAQRAWDEDGSEEAQARIFEIKRQILYGGEGTEAITDSAG